MNERVRELHRKIAAWRDMLAQGPAASEAVHYLRQIMEAEAELERIKIAKVQPPVRFRATTAAALRSSPLSENGEKRTLRHALQNV